MTTNGHLKYLKRHCTYMYQDSKLLVLLNWFRLVYGPSGQRNMHCTLNFTQSRLARKELNIPNLKSTLRCQINESTRLSFLDFSPPCLHFFHPTRLANFPSYSFFRVFLHPKRLLGPICLGNLYKISTLLVYLALLV